MAGGCVAHGSSVKRHVLVSYEDDDRGMMKIGGDGLTEGRHGRSDMTSEGTSSK